MKKEYFTQEELSFVDATDHEKHGLRGVVQIYRKNKETGEVSFWDESSNIIPISGYQWILMKMFNLFLDSSHGKVTDNLTKDTTLAIPDLNNKINIGTKSDEYTVMNENIPSTHFCQGFIVGNGGAGEDVVTTKNTAYSFVSLRKPIPFQQFSSTGLNASIAGQYLGKYNGTTGSTINSVFIKKFDTTPHIYHSWWVDSQRWDYVDKVTEGYLGPDSATGVMKTNRIETYVECQLSLSDTDCKAYFNHEGVNETSMINELGLVAYDAIQGERSIIETCYSQLIEPFLKVLFSHNWMDQDSYEQIEFDRVVTYILDISEIFTDELTSKLSKQVNLKNFITQLKGLNHESDTLDIAITVNDVEEFKSFITNDNDVEDSQKCIGVEAYYNQNGTLQYVTDNFLTYLKDSSTSELSIDEAQRIKLITYYTFNSIPISENWEILINYRIYAN